MDKAYMCTTSLLRIDLKALHEGENTAVYELDDAYFKAIAAPDIQKGTLALRFKAKRIGDLYELDFHVEGIVYVACDICLEEMGLPIQNDGKLTARLGEENVEDGDMVIVDKEDGVLDASWYVYELIALAIPIKHVHEPGQCDPAMVAKLQQLSADGERPGEVESIDPRWAKLQQLRTED